MRRYSAGLALHRPSVGGMTQETRLPFAGGQFHFVSPQIDASAGLALVVVARRHGIKGCTFRHSSLRKHSYRDSTKEKLALSKAWPFRAGRATRPRFLINAKIKSA